MSTAQIIMAVISYFLVGILCCGYRRRFDLSRRASDETALVFFFWPAALLFFAGVLVVNVVLFLIERVEGEY